MTFDSLLASASTSTIGDIGEETARDFVETFRDVIIVSVGDSQSERHDGRQDTDIVAAIDGELIAYEVKTRYASRRAGHLTRSGDLPYPRLRRGRTRASGEKMPDQGTGEYYRGRLEHLVETDGDPESRVLFVDLRGGWIQEFGVDPSGRISGRLSDVEDCTESITNAIEALFG